MPTPKGERAARARASGSATWRPNPRPRRSDAGPGAVGFPGYPIGSHEHCWCGKPRNHTWPGKGTNAPHPPALTPE